MSQQIRIRSKAGPDDKDLFRNTFPFFIWLLRDVSNTLPPDCKDLNQFFAKRVFKESSATTSDERERQKATESILQLFAGFDAFALPIPTQDSEVLEDIGNSREKLSEKFLQGLKEFEVLLKSKLAPKPSVNKGERITGKALGALIKLYTDALNDPDAIPNVEAAWDTYVKKTCSEAKTHALGTYDQNMTQVMTSIFPCEVQELLKCHEYYQRRCMKIFEKEMAEFTSTCIDEDFNELLENTDQQMKAWKTKNALCTRQACEELLRGLKASYVDPILKRVRNSRLGEEVKYGDIMDKCNAVTNQFHKKATGAKYVRAEVFFKFTEELLEEVSKHEEILSKMRDYNEDLAKDKMVKAYQEIMKMKLQEDINQMKKKEKAWERKVTMLQEKQQTEIENVREQAKAEKKSLERNLEIMKDANMRVQKQFQAQVNAAAERERQANQALKDLRQQCRSEKRKAQEQKEGLRKEMQTLAEGNEKAQAQLKQQLEAHNSRVKQNSDMIRDLQDQLTNSEKELSSLSRQKESLQAQLKEATKPGFFRWIKKSLFG